ncbi:MAG: hypothetical protein K2J27_09685 [Duncaniella sp.]|nr:hypothetical protein [Duncaniella sp.]
MKSSTSIVYNGTENSQAPVTNDDEGIITCLIDFARGDSGHMLCSGKGTSVEVKAVAIIGAESVSESVGISCPEPVSPISANEKKDDSDMRTKKNTRRFMVKNFKVIFKWSL